MPTISGSLYNRPDARAADGQLITEIGKAIPENDPENRATREETRAESG